VVEHCHHAKDIRGLAVTSLLSIAVGAAVFGGVTGAFRGGTQIAHAALKTPMSLLWEVLAEPIQTNGHGAARSKRTDFKVKVHLTILNTTDKHKIHHSSIIICER
jgi:hypothetical protein